MVNYQKGKIYAIRSHQTDKVYIGSTTQVLSARLGSHVREKKYYEDGIINYITSFEMLEFDDYYIELLELCPCDSKEELHKREGEIIRTTPNCVNKYIPGRTNKQWKIDNKDILKEKRKQYNIKNRPNRIQYDIDNKDKLQQYRIVNKDKLNQCSTQWYIDNKDKIKDSRKQYYAKNKDKIEQKCKAPYTCDVCNITMRRDSRSKHNKTKKHLDNL